MTLRGRNSKPWKSGLNPDPVPNIEHFFLKRTASRPSKCMKSAAANGPFVVGRCPVWPYPVTIPEHRHGTASIWLKGEAMDCVRIDFSTAALSWL